MAFVFKKDMAQHSLDRGIYTIAKEIGDSQIKNKKEQKFLSHVVEDGEKIIAQIMGSMDNTTWLITLTDRQLAFLNKGLISEIKSTSINLENINNVSTKGGMILGEIHFKDGNEDKKIINMAKEAAAKFTEKINETIGSNQSNEEVIENEKYEHAIDEKVDLVFTGKFTDIPNEVITKVAALFNIDESKVKPKLIPNKKATIFEAISLDKASKYGKAITRAGAVCKIARKKQVEAQGDTTKKKQDSADDKKDISKSKLEQSQEEKNKKASGGCLGCLTIIFILFILFSIFSMCSGGGNGKSSSSDKHGAYVACQSFVKQRLKSPSSADFPWGADSSADVGAGKWLINGHVDAKNSFGVDVRTKYSCTVQRSGSSWNLINLQMN